ncbi:MAG: response regulator transcription factor [Balneolales bacterium]|nr:response regulator transcription factor [Balneolales bacterium]
MSDKKKQIAIVEDNVKIRDLIKQYLNMQEDMECRNGFSSVENLLQVMKEGDMPDIILMDIDLEGMSGIDGMKLIKGKYSDVEIIMLTVYHDSHKIFNSLRAGASGYLLKHTSLPEIKDAIDVVLQGGAPMSPQIARKVITHFSGGPSDEPEKADSGLTMREQEIVVGLVDGLSYKMIADRMDISIDTVRAHIRNIYKKLHVNSKAEVIAKSLRGEI